MTREATLSMMQKTEISFEITETVVVSRGAEAKVAFCLLCDSTTDMVSPEILAIISDSSERSIFRLIEAETLYYVETPRTLVCLGCFSSAMRGSYARQSENNVALTGEPTK